MCPKPPQAININILAITTSRYHDIQVSTATLRTGSDPTHTMSYVCVSGRRLCFVAFWVALTLRNTNDIRAKCGARRYQLAKQIKRYDQHDRWLFGSTRLPWQLTVAASQTVESSNIISNMFYSEGRIS